MNRIPSAGSSRNRSHRPMILWAAAAAMTPLLFALVIAVEPTLTTVTAPKDEGGIPFVLERNNQEGIPDSLRDAFKRSDELLTTFRSQEAFLKAQLAEASSTEPSIAVDLHDSVVVLSIRGVPIRVGTILSSEKSVLFDRLSRPGSLPEELKTPFTLIGATATVPRIPMRIIRAPKDTAEARLHPPDAFVAAERNVYSELYFDRNVTLVLIPAEEGRSTTGALRQSLILRFQEARRTIHRFFSEERAPPARWIRLEMPSDDIRAIFRALPDGGKMAIRW
jgi:hypothetical protein